MQTFRNSDHFPQNLIFLHILYHEADLSYRGGRQKAHKGVPLEIWQYFYIYYCKGIFKHIIFHNFGILESHLGVLAFTQAREKPNWTVFQSLSWFSKLRVFKYILEIGLGLQDQCCLWNILPFNYTTPESKGLFRICWKCTMCLAPNGSVQHLLIFKENALQTTSFFFNIG